jgi:hypothetical protein
MKRNISILLFFGTMFILAACNKTNIHNTEDHVGISRVTHFATFQMTGSNYVSIVQGTPFTEPGIKAFEGSTQIPVTTTGTVNSNVPGLYVLTYSAMNKDSFSATATRNVVVLASHEVPGTDLSGKYNYVGSSTYTATVTKVAEGTYTTDNAWSGATVIPLLFVSTDGLTISVPNQNSAFGPLFGTGTYTPGTKRLVYTLSLPSQGISNSNRTWQRQ